MGRNKALAPKQLEALRVLRDPRWEKAVRFAFHDETTTVAQAAEELGVSVRRLWRWIREIEDVKGRLPRATKGGYRR